MKKVSQYSIATVLISALTFGSSGQALAATTVDLGAADDFVVLAGTAVTNVPTSAITGDVGLSPDSGSNYVGVTAAQVNGTIYAVDSAGPAGSVNNPTLLTQAKNDLTTAYNDAAGRTTTSTIGTALGGTTLPEGTYDSSAGTFEIAAGATLTLNGQGNADAIFIFKMASTLVTGASSQVALINSAQACNVFWQVGSSPNLGTNSVFKGNILTLTSATLTTGANVEGRVLARNAAVTLNSNTITKATCAIPTTVSPPGSTGATLTSTGSSFDAASNASAASDASTLPDAGPSTGAFAAGTSLLYGLWRLRPRLRK